MTTLGIEGLLMKHERQEHEILFDNHSPKSIKRLALSILLLQEGVQAHIISRAVGVSPRQVCNYRKTYEEKGDVAFTDDIRYRPVSELEAYKDLIKADLSARPVATSAEACERIHELTGIKRSPTQVRQYMHRLGLKPLKVAAIPAKANPLAQSDFLEQVLEPRIKEAEKGERVLLFMDAAHFVWQLYLGVLWCLSRIFIPAASGRTRINVLGAYDPIKNVLVKIVNRSYINSSTVIELLERIKTLHLDKAISIVLDNAKYQRCKAVIGKAAELGIELLFLPTYSPNLNLIERLWRFVKKECLYSKYYKTANDFESAIVNCLDDINIGKKPKLKTLMTLKFQLFPFPSSESGINTKAA
jgi:transposase